MTNSEAVSVCPNCGGPIEVRRDGSTEGLYCTRCDWSVVTTHIPEIELDANTYEISVRDGDYQNQRHVKAVANVANVNFLDARRLLQDSEAVVFRGKAGDTLKARQVLLDAGMDVKITPDFPW